MNVVKIDKTCFTCLLFYNVGIKINKIKTVVIVNVK